MRRKRKTSSSPPYGLCCSFVRQKKAKTIRQLSRRVSCTLLVSIQRSCAIIGRSWKQSLKSYSSLWRSSFQELWKWRATRSWKYPKARVISSLFNSRISSSLTLRKSSVEFQKRPRNSTTRLCSLSFTRLSGTWFQPSKTGKHNTTTLSRLWVTTCTSSKTSLWVHRTTRTFWKRSRLRKR